MDTTPAALGIHVELLVTTFNTSEGQIYVLAASVHITFASERLDTLGWSLIWRDMPQRMCWPKASCHTTTYVQLHSCSRWGQRSLGALPIPYSFHLQCYYPLSTMSKRPATPSSETVKGKMVRIVMTFAHKIQVLDLLLEDLGASEVGRRYNVNKGIKKTDINIPQCSFTW